MDIPLVIVESFIAETLHLPVMMILAVFPYS